MIDFKKIIKIFVIFAIFGLSFSSFFVLNHNMENEHSGKMSNCLFMTTNSISTSCQMSVGEHLLVWQETFLANISSSFIFILSFLSILLFVYFVKYVGTDPPLRFLIRYNQENRGLNIYNYFLRALSKGIVHPEVYA